MMDSDSKDRLIRDHMMAIDDLLSRMRFSDTERCIRDRAVSLLAALRRNGQRSNVHKPTA